LVARARIALAGLVLVSAMAGAVGCGSSDSSATGETTATPKFDGASAKPQKPVPPLELDNSLGQPVNIADYRGKAVLVTFIYDHCPDICPLIVSNLHAAQNEMSSAERKQLRIIAVSVDPKGDTPKTVNAFLADHQMTGRMQYLIGSRPRLENVWHDWSIVSKTDPGRKNPDAVEHSALIYGISGSGKMTTLYPANFEPKQIVHDVPLLASS
jgi:protein SCO1/2